MEDVQYDLDYYRVLHYRCHSQYQEKPPLFLDMGLYQRGLVCGGFLSRPLQPGVLIPDLFRACGIRDMALEAARKMKWFKHLSGSLKDSIIFEAIEKFGGDGYLVFFGTLEMMADEFDIYQPDRVTLSIKKMTNLLQLSRQKTLRILSFFDEKAKKFQKENKSFFAEVSDTHVTIICSKFASLADNHTTNELAKTKKLLISDLEVTYPQDIKKEDNTDNKKNKEDIPAPDLSFDSFFDDFWNTYPSRNGKKLGKDECKKYCRRFKNGDRELILQGTKNYAASKQAKEGYAKDPIRFLRKEAFREWQEPERDPNDAYDW